MRGQSQNAFSPGGPHNLSCVPNCWCNLEQVETLTCTDQSESKALCPKQSSSGWCSWCYPHFSPTQRVSWRTVLGPRYSCSTSHG